MISSSRFLRLSCLLSLLGIETAVSVSVSKTSLSGISCFQEIGGGCSRFVPLQRSGGPLASTPLRGESVTEAADLSLPVSLSRRQAAAARASSLTGALLSSAILSGSAKPHPAFAQTQGSGEPLLDKEELLSRIRKVETGPPSGVNLSSVSSIKCMIREQEYPLKEILGKSGSIVMNFKVEDKEAKQIKNLCFFARRFPNFSLILQPTDQGYIETEKRSSDKIRGIIVRDYLPTTLGNVFVLDKADLVGSSACPLFRYLGDSLPNPLARYDGEYVSLNCEKFLLDGDGRPVRRYPRKWKPAQMLDEVTSLCKESKVLPPPSEYEKAWLSADNERSFNLFSFQKGVNW